MPAKVAPSTLPALLLYDASIYRPAGYRVPEPEETYVAENGHIKVRGKGNTAPRQRVLIVRLFNAAKDFK